MMRIIDNFVSLEKIRTFLSLNIPGELVPAFKEHQDSAKKALSGHPVKWEDPAKLHLTLRFLGDIPREKIDGLVFTLERLKPGFDSIKFTATGIGFFPNAKYPNVVFTSLEEKGDHSSRLVEFIDKIIFNFGVKPEKRFVPHVTLGRFRKDKRVKIESPVDITVEPIEAEFETFYLMKSVLTPAGSVYEKLNEFTFSK